MTSGPLVQEFPTRGIVLSERTGTQEAARAGLGVSVATTAQSASLVVCGISSREGAIH